MEPSTSCHKHTSLGLSSTFPALMPSAGPERPYVARGTESMYDRQMPANAPKPCPPIGQHMASRSAITHAETSASKPAVVACMDGRREVSSVERRVRIAVMVVVCVRACGKVGYRWEGRRTRG